MSLFDRQSLAVIAVIHGAVLSTKSSDRTIGPVFLNKVNECDALLKIVGKQWPVSPKESDQFIVEWVRSKLDTWASKQAAINDEWLIVGLVAMAMTALTDLDVRVERRKTRTRWQIEYPMHLRQYELLQPVFASLQDVLDEIDPRGSRHDIYEHTDMLLDSLNELLEIPKEV